MRLNIKGAALINTNSDALRKMPRPKSKKDTLGVLTKSQTRKNNYNHAAEESLERRQTAISL